MSMPYGLFEVEVTTAERCESLLMSLAMQATGLDSLQLSTWRFMGLRREIAALGGSRGS